jgi:hypothetical protein
MLRYPLPPAFTSQLGCLCFVFQTMRLSWRGLPESVASVTWAVPVGVRSICRSSSIPQPLPSLVKGYFCFFLLRVRRLEPLGALTDEPTDRRGGVSRRTTDEPTTQSRKKHTNSCLFQKISSFSFQSIIYCNTNTYIYVLPLTLALYVIIKHRHSNAV